MAKFIQTTFQKRKHEKAFEFYSEVDSEGRRRSNNAIAKMVGVTASAVAYWKRRDNWDGKLLAKVDEAIDEATLTNRNIKKLLRESLFRHIKSLNTVIEFSKSDGDKVTAIKAFVHIAKELDCLTPDTGAGELAENLAPAFTDDLAQTDPAADPPEHPVSGEDPVFALPAADPLKTALQSAGL